MNKPHTSAGVYTRIRDFSRMPTVDNGIRIGMVGAMERGPVNMVWRTISPEDWRTYFGRRNMAKFGMAGIVAHYCHQFTNQVYNVRLAPEAQYGVLHLTVDDPKANIPKFNLAPHTDNDGNVIGVTDVAELGWLPDDPLNSVEPGFFYQANPGMWGRNYRVFLLPNNPAGLDPIKNRTEYNTNLFKLMIFENYVAGSMPVESHTVSFDSYIDSEERQYEIGEVLERDSTILRWKRNSYCPAFQIMRSANSALLGGADGRLPNSDEIAEAYKQFFSDREELSCHLLVNSMGFDHIVHRAMLSVCENHDNCRAFLNVAPDRQSVRNAVNYRNSVLNVDTFYGALYTGDLLVYDEEESRKVYVPLVAFAAGAYAAARFVTAPAGLDMSTHIKVLGARYEYDQPERNVLTDNQINYVRKMPEALGGTYALWEQLTLYRRQSTLRNINVSATSGRVLELAASRAKWGLFDPNDDVLRKEMVTQISDELEILNRQGAFNVVDGATPFEVICDERNNTNQSNANGDLIIDVIIDPANSIRRIIMRYNINPKGSRVTEIAA